MMKAINLGVTAQPAPPPAVPRSLLLAPGAVRKVASLLQQPDNAGKRLRVYVSGGGCSGYSYGFEMAGATEPGDTEIHEGDALVVVDEQSMDLLKGATLDYVEDLSGSRFVVNNPNATATCGCGVSFSA
jgi:iron-sulfur cluster insertion protein